MTLEEMIEVVDERRRLRLDFSVVFIEVDTLIKGLTFSHK